MNASLLTRIFLGIMSIAAFGMADSPALAQEVDSRLVKVLADWKKKRERIQSIYYKVEGEYIIPKGSLKDNQGSPAKPAPPPQDVFAPIKWSLHLDMLTK